MRVSVTRLTSSSNVKEIEIAAVFPQHQKRIINILQLRHQRFVGIQNVCPSACKLLAISIRQKLRKYPSPNNENKYQYVMHV